MPPPGGLSFWHGRSVTRLVQFGPNGDPSGRLLPPRNDRPPATRLVSPRGIALKLYLTALFVAQSRSAGELPGNKLPLADPDAPVSWIDLVATTAERHRYVGQREKKLRQVQDALRRLYNPRVQLVELPNFHSQPAGKYESFLLMREGGAPYGGGDNQLYTVPATEAHTMLLSGGLFLNAWIQVLEDSELGFLLMLACIRVGSKPVFASSETRLLQFSLGRDAYEAHRILSELGIVKVQADPNRRSEGEKARRYTRSNPPKLHRFELLNDGFGKPAVPTMRHVLQQRHHETELSVCADQASTE
jgi:hypothetical protein